MCETRNVRLNVNKFYVASFYVCEQNIKLGGKHSCHFYLQPSECAKVKWEEGGTPCMLGQVPIGKHIY